MANISDVINGRMTLAGDWSPLMKTCINIVKQQWGCGEYGTWVDGDFGKDVLTVEFNAAGRWNYGENLKNIGVWTRQSKSKKVLAAYETLCRELAEKEDADGTPTAWIELYFKENEPGCQILRECNGEIRLIDGNLTGFITDETNYDYTAENLVELDFYDSIEDVDCFDDEDA